MQTKSAFADCLVRYVFFSCTERAFWGARPGRRVGCAGMANVLQLVRIASPRFYGRERASNPTNTDQTNTKEHSPSCIVSTISGLAPISIERWSFYYSGRGD